MKAHDPAPDPACLNKAMYELAKIIPDDDRQAMIVNLALIVPEFKHAPLGQAVPADGGS
jgi:hypothetical protein